MKREKLIVLNYETTTVDIYDVSPEADVDEEYVQNLGFNTNMCSWMVGDDMEIVHHKGILM